MSVFSGIVGHEAILRILEHALVKPAHGYLFCGPRGAGKTTVAERLAIALLCEAGGRRQEAGQNLSTIHDSRLSSHPDFVRLQREEGAKEIVVKQVRELILRMQLTSARGGYKVALIEQADRLNEEAANALLKVVEEPSLKTVYIFLAEQPDRLPATLRSRLVKVEFGRVATKVIEGWLQEAGGRGQGAGSGPKVSGQRFSEVAEQSRGCPGVAWRFAFGEEEAWHTTVDWSGLTASLLAPPLGKQLAAIEKMTQAVESQDDVETAWREALERVMQVLDAGFEQNPEAALRLGKGLARAWHLVGSAISPRLGIEWALIPEEAKQGRVLPRIMG